MRSQKTIQLAETALMSAVLCVLAPFTIPLPVSPVPLSLATFVVYLAAVLLGAKRGAVSVLIYLLLGLVGLPVFSCFSGGVGVLLGPTGGYLVGYVLCAVIVGWLTERGSVRNRLRKKPSVEETYAKDRENGGLRQTVWHVFAMTLGTLACYTLGTAWFLVLMKGSYTLTRALLVCVVPYLPFDMIKIFAAAAVAVPIKKILRRIKQ